jgi:two-component system nitrate/nitrite response regulator NarP
MTRILLADDHPFVLTGVETALAGSRFKVVAKVGDGVALLESLDRIEVDIFVIDVQMPKLDGIGALRELRNRGGDQKVILLTADLDDQRLLEALALRVNGIVLKDGGGAALLRCLDLVSSNRRCIEPELLQRFVDLTMREERVSEQLGSLTKREREVVELVCAGHRNREIAKKICTTEGTVKVYLHRIYEKLQVKSRMELALLVRDLTDS